MKQTVTHDELVKFAAEKLGISVRRYAKDEWYDLDNYEIREHGVGAMLFDLNSWDLLGKGVAVADHEYGFDLDNRRGWLFWKKQVMSTHATQSPMVNVPIDEITDIPLAFWTVWYELEQQNKQGGVK